MAIVFACNNFSQYVYGRKKRVETDHKPLEAIVNKPLWKASPRQQRMLLKLQKYTLDVTYVPGKEMYDADTLSRAFLSDYGGDFDPEMDLIVHSSIRNLPMTAEKLLHFQKATKEDNVLSMVIDFVKSGWPEHKHGLPSENSYFWPMRDEIHTADKLAFIGEKLVVPKEL